MMKAAEMKEYLKMLVELEKQAYTQDRMIAELEYEIPRLAIPSRIEEPHRVKIDTFDNDCVNWLAVGAVAVVLGISIRFLRTFFFIVAAVCFFFTICGTLSLHMDDKEHETRYLNQLQEYRRVKELDKIRVEDEFKRKMLMEAELKNLKRAHAKTKQVLEKLYSKNIIHPKYHGMIPVCSLYGYFDTGVCAQLEGHEGAYNKYDTESRLDYIICKMDEVLKHLDEIKGNQYQLYVAINESNDKCDRLISNTSQMMSRLDGIHAQGRELNSRIADIQLTSALTLYETDCSRRELEYMNRANRLY